MAEDKNILVKSVIYKINVYEYLYEIPEFTRNIKKCLNFLIWYDKIRMLCNE